VTAPMVTLHAQDDENNWANPPPSVDCVVVQHVRFLA
jgi:hypothetical protein